MRLLRGLSAEDRRFVCELAVFEWIDPELVDEVLGSADAGARIAALSPLGHPVFDRGLGSSGGAAQERGGFGVMVKSLVIAMNAVAAGLMGSLPAAAQDIHWSADIRAEEHVFDDGGKLYVGYLRGVFGNIRGDRQFEYDGVTYTVLGFYITNEPRSLLVGLTKFGGVGAHLPADANLAFRVDGKLFALSDISRTAGEEYVVWDNSGLDWSGGQVVSVELVEGATPVPALPLAGAGLLSLLLGFGWYRHVAGLRSKAQWRPR